MHAGRTGQGRAASRLAEPDAWDDAGVQTRGNRRAGGSRCVCVEARIGSNVGNNIKPVASQLPVHCRQLRPLSPAGAAALRGCPQLACCWAGQAVAWGMVGWWLLLLTLGSPVVPLVSANHQEAGRRQGGK